MLQNEMRSIIYNRSNQILQNKLQFNIKFYYWIYSVITFMCKKLNKLEV